MQGYRRYQITSKKKRVFTLPSNDDPYNSHKNPNGNLEYRHGNNKRRDRKSEKCLEKNI